GGDGAGADEAVDDLVNDRALARALRAVEQIAAAVQVAVGLELVAEVPERLDLLEDLRRQAVGEVDEVVDLEIASDELDFAVLVEGATVGAGRQAQGGDARDFEDAGLHNLPLDGPVADFGAGIVTGRVVVVLLIVARPAVVDRLAAEVVEVHGGS